MDERLKRLEAFVQEPIASSIDSNQPEALVQEPIASDNGGNASQASLPPHKKLSSLESGISTSQLERGVFIADEVQCPTFHDVN